MGGTGEDFAARLLAAATRMETILAATLDAATPLLSGTPERLLAAMHHGALGGGKRIRPFLVLESARLFGEPGPGADQVAAALELVHCYSLVHDDLPAMDDDDLRRGRPTVHKAYDEASAILAGDCLLTLAFGLVAQAHELPAQARVELIAALSRRMVAWGLGAGVLAGALLAFACEAGAILTAAPTDDRARLRRYGETIGLAFQLADDLLDETADTAALGKAAGKDRERGKKTLPALQGIEWTRARLDALVAESEALLAPYGGQAETLIAAARFIAVRTS